MVINVFFIRGKFGEVKKCKEKKTGRFLAAKFIAVNGLQERDDVINEVDIMKTLQHPRLLQLYDAFEKKDTFCIVTELWVKSRIEITLILEMQSFF